MATIRIVTPDQKCPVCCGPRRIPSGFEVAAIEGAVELAQEVLKQELEALMAAPGRVVDDVAPEDLQSLIAAAKLLGAQEARKELM